MGDVQPYSVESVDRQLILCALKKALQSQAGLLVGIPFGLVGVQCLGVVPASRVRLVS